MGWSEKMSNLTDACQTAMGQTVTCTPATGDPYTLEGIFDENFVAVDPASETEVTSVHPVLFVKLSDMEAPPAKGDEVTIGGVDYRVIQPQDDSEGGTRLLLHKI